MKIGIISESLHEKKHTTDFLEKILTGLQIPHKEIYENNFDLVCVRKGKKKSVVLENEAEERFNNNEILYKIEVTALEIPYSENLSDKLLKKYMYSALRKLKSREIDKIAFTDEIKRVYAVENLTQEILGRDFSQAVILSLRELIKKLSAKCGINPVKTQLAVISQKYTNDAYKTILEIVYDVGYIKIYTYDASRYLRMCDNLYDRFGIVADVYDYKTADKINDLIICDLDSGILKIGRDIIVNDVKYKMNCAGYGVRDIEILDLINENPKNFTIKYCIGGKNRLTI